MKTQPNEPSQPCPEATLSPLKGLTKREYFAVEIFSAMLSRDEFASADYAVVSADELIHALNKTQ